jgi:hypothetical protein
MTCTEFERVLPEIIDGGRTIEQEGHLGSCPACWELVRDLHSISIQARLLRSEEAEPNARVWRFIEIALRQEGLIREPQQVEPQPAKIEVSRSRRWWSSAWWLPVSAMLLVSAGVLRYQQRRPVEPTTASKQPVVVSDLTLSDDQQLLQTRDDQQLLETVQTRSPAMLASYQANLKNVNAYIRDAEDSAKNNPNDEEAQRILMNAYAQKSMVYEMALDRSMP